jgi:hypothetical protein
VSRQSRVNEKSGPACTILGFPVKPQIQDEDTTLAYEWLTRDLKESLKNYKELRMAEAKKKGVAEEFAAATTLTRARKIMQGQKVRDP